MIALSNPIALVKTLRVFCLLSLLACSNALHAELPDAEPCYDFNSSGSSVVPISIEVVSASMQPLESARVRLGFVYPDFQKLPYEFALENPVEGFTDAEGEITLEYRFDSFREIRKDGQNCRRASGFVPSFVYLIVESDGFLTYYQDLGKTDLQTTFGIDERMQSELFIILLPDTL